MRPPPTWSVYPGFPVGGLSDYGWHFDESSGPQWGARDYNYGGDEGVNVVFSAKLTQNSTYQIRWRFEQLGNCSLKVIMQANFFGWVDVDRTEMHHIHLVDRVSTGTTTAVVQSNGQSVFSFLGHSGLCGTSEYHSHEASDFSPGTRVTGVRYSTDTCWSDTDDFTGTNLYQCPGSGFKAHDSIPPPSCPPGGWNGGYYLLSGTLAQYYCELWSNISKTYTVAAFTGTW